MLCGDVVNRIHILILCCDVVNPCLGGSHFVGVQFTKMSGQSVLPPRSFADLLDWPSWALRRLTAPGGPASNDRKLRLHEILKRGVIVNSDYSGMSGEREILQHLGSAFKKEYGWPWAADYFKMHRVCDIGPLQQQVLAWTARELEKSQTCIFQDMNDRLPKHVQALLDAAMPTETDGLFTAASAYDEMFGWLRRERATLFNANTVSPCILHGKLCSAYGPWRDVDVGTKQPPQKKPRLHVSDNDEDSSGENDCLSNDCGSSDELRIAFGGTTCKGWAAAGVQKRFADPSERAHSIFTCERMALAEAEQEDVFISECVYHYPADLKLGGPLAESHHVIGTDIKPTDLGWPVRRHRILTAGLNRKTCLWVGGPDPAAEFADLYHCQNQLDGSTFLHADEEQLFNEGKRRAKLRSASQP